MADPTNEAPALNPNDPLDAIALEAAGMEAEADRAQQEALGVEPEPAVDPAQMWAQIPHMFGRLVGMAMPELIPVYNDAACLQWGMGMADVADKYGWDAGETMAKWGPEIALTVATIPLAVPTFHAIKARKRAYDARKAAQEARTGDDGTPRPMHDLNDPPAASTAATGQEPGNFSEPH